MRASFPLVGLLAACLTQAPQHTATTGTTTGTPTDVDGDGHLPSQGDCDDLDPAVHPGAPEVDGDGLDSDCDGIDGTGEPLDAVPVLEGAHGWGFGADVATGDFDGDGRADVVVLDRDASASTKFGGMPAHAHLYAGPLLLGAVPVARATDPDGAERILAPGDLDGDAADDLVIFGALDATAHAGALHQELFTLVGFTGSGGCGGDLDGDGLRDAVVGNGTGVWLISGDTRGHVSLDAAIGAAPGGNPACGDLDGDGAVDLIVAAGDAVRIWRGPWSGTVDQAGAAGAWLGAPADGLDRAISPVGDVDGDGATDLLHTAFEADDRAGRVSLIPGPALGDHDLDDAVATFHGDAANDWLGSELVDAGDLDDDGYADLVLGAPSSASVGAVYLFRGPRTGSWDAHQADRIWVGPDGSYAGWGLAAGDLDDDGATDLAVAGFGADRVWLLLDPD